MPYTIEKLTALPARAILSFTRAPGEDVQCEGWLLKKRLHKHPGFAPRYFILRASGILSCALHPQLTPREQFSLHTATISSSSLRRDIHIDFENGTYHVKATSASDFEMWMAAFRKFIQVGTLNRTLSLQKPINLFSGPPMSSVSIALDEMSFTISELDDALKSAKNSEHGKKHGIQIKLRKDSGKDREGFRNIFRRTTDNNPPEALDAAEGAQSSSFFGNLMGSVETLKSQLDGLRKLLAQQENSVTAVLASPVDSLHYPFSPKAPGGRPPRKDSAGTSASEDAGAASIWYDAAEGPEEFVITDDAPSADVSEPDLSNSNSVEDMLTVDVERDEQRESAHTVVAFDESLVVRRTVLPAPVSGDEVSLFALLRKNIGKDLSTVSFPVTSNEPLGLLQRVAEEMEYIELLSQACATTDATERMCLVAAFAISGFACTRLRSGRKPFTPMLGETFEDIRTKFIAEKVSNHPLVIACHAEGNGWEWWGTNAGKNHFWGKSLELEPTGATHLRIGDDHFQWHRPSSFVRNLVVGTKFLEHVGSLSIQNLTTGARCAIDFKEAGFWGIPNVVAGSVYSPHGEVVTRLEGTWHEQVSQVLSASHLRVLWRANAYPEHAPQYYGFTSFATTLNEITKDIEGKLPPTDTRYRPDLRALEEGNVALAEAEKTRVEEAQRERRSKGTEVEPRWFKKLGLADYAYNGGYWEQRAKGWSGYLHLW